MQQLLTQNGTTFADEHNQQWLGFSFKRKKVNKRDIAISYFQLLSAFNNLKLSEGEIKLLAHIALNKGVISGPCKIGYVENHNSSIAAVDNTISKLKKKKLLIKKDNTVFLHPKITLDFSNQDNFIFSFKCVLQTNT
jgi:hypothetical protein